MVHLAPEYWRKIALELKLRKLSGDAFQDFFSEVMEQLHGDDFVRVRAYGSRGDKGCDGYLRSTGQVFQCYGAVAGASDKVKTLVTKMTEDFGKARKHLSDIMKEWHMVHNIVDGLPTEAIQALKSLEDNNPDISFGFVGAQGFEARLNELSSQQVAALIGPVATSIDSRNLQTEELRDLVDAVAQAATSIDMTAGEIGPVPVDKLDANNLPGHWYSLISGGWQNAYLVSEYINHHPQPLIGERIARLLTEQYQYYKQQHLGPGDIMRALYVSVTGEGTVSPERQVAAQALLAHLFESCDIFENLPEKTAQ